MNGSNIESLSSMENDNSNHCVEEEIGLKEENVVGKNSEIIN